MQEKVFKEYLEKFKKIIFEAVERRRLDDQLVGFVKDVEKVSEISYRITGPVRIQEKTQFDMTIKHATPQRMHLRVHVEDWANRPNEIDMGPTMSQLGVQFVAPFEKLAIVNGLLSEVGREFTDGHTKERVMESINWIADNGHYPNRLLANPLDRALLEKEGVIIPIWQRKGSRFYEMAQGGLDVYWIPQIQRGIAIIYEKEGVTLERTPLRICFDDMNQPKYLIVEQERLASPFDEKAVVKMNFSAESS